MCSLSLSVEVPSQNEKTTPEGTSLATSPGVLTSESPTTCTTRHSIPPSEGLESVQKKPQLDTDTEPDDSSTSPPPSLRVLLNELHSVRDSWYNIGLQLGIPHTELDCIRHEYENPLDLLREMLRKWLDIAINPRPSWKAVITALRSPIVDKKHVAEQLESKYCKGVLSKLLQALLKKAHTISLFL